MKTIKYITLRNLWITELKKRIIQSSTYWNTQLLKETCDKIKSKYTFPDFKKKKVLDFLICEYARQPWISVRFPEDYYN